MCLKRRSSRLCCRSKHAANTCGSTYSGNVCIGVHFVEVIIDSDRLYDTNCDEDNWPREELRELQKQVEEKEVAMDREYIFKFMFDSSGGHAWASLMRRVAMLAGLLCADPQQDPIGHSTFGEWLHAEVTDYLLKYFACRFFRRYLPWVSLPKHVFESFIHHRLCQLVLMMPLMTSGAFIWCLCCNRGHTYLSLHSNPAWKNSLVLQTLHSVQKAALTQMRACSCSTAEGSTQVRHREQWHICRCPCATGVEWFLRDMYGFDTDIAHVNVKEVQIFCFSH